MTVSTSSAPHGPGSDVVAEGEHRDQRIAQGDFDRVRNSEKPTGPGVRRSGQPDPFGRVQASGGELPLCLHRCQDLVTAAGTAGAAASKAISPAPRPGWTQTCPRHPAAANSCSNSFRTDMREVSRTRGPGSQRLTEVRGRRRLRFGAGTGRSGPIPAGALRLFVYLTAPDLQREKPGRRSNGLPRRSQTARTGFPDRAGRPRVVAAVRRSSQGSRAGGR